MLAISLFAAAAEKLISRYSALTEQKSTLPIANEPVETPGVLDG